MSDLVRLVTWESDEDVTPQDDALIYEAALDSGFFYGGNVTIKNTNTLHITAGHGLIAGRKFTIFEGDLPVVLPSSGNMKGRVYMHLDLSNASLPCDVMVEIGATLTPPIQEADVNIFNGVYEFDMVYFDVSTTEISNLNVVIPRIEGEGGIAKYIGCAKLTVPNTGWSQVTVDGETYFKRDVSVTAVNDEHPDVFAAPGGNNTFPTAEQLKAFNKLSQVIAGTDKLTFYASAAPSDTFYVYARGVQA